MITVLGASGFIGGRLVQHLTTRGIQHQAVPRDSPLPVGSLGTVIYAIGVTSDFACRARDAMEAHVGRLVDLAAADRFDRLVYLSSARVYGWGDALAREDEALIFSPADPDQLYNVSKAAGEALTLSLGSRGQVIRLAHVYSADQRKGLLPDLIDAMRATGRATLREHPSSLRDFVHVDDMVTLISRIAIEGRHRIYNAGSGHRVALGETANALAAAGGWAVDIVQDAPLRHFRPLDVSRIRNEFGFSTRPIADDIAALLEGAR